MKTQLVMLFECYFTYMKCAVYYMTLCECACEKTECSGSYQVSKRSGPVHWKKSMSIFKLKLNFFYLYKVVILLLTITVIFFTETQFYNCI